MCDDTREDPCLYLVPTPIGNMEDITLRALRILKETDVLLAEDTRTTAVLLKHFGIEVPELRSHHKHNEHSTVKRIVEELKAGKKVAQVSDAGLPGISDPGMTLVQACIQNEIRVEALPGPTAFATALVASGLPSDRFYFEGFLPQKKGRLTKLTEILERDCTSILYEAPTRLLKLLEQIRDLHEDDRYIVVAREISKIYEEYRRGRVSELLSYFQENPPRGEMVVLVSAAPEEKKVHRNKFKS